MMPQMERAERHLQSVSKGLFMEKNGIVHRGNSTIKHPEYIISFRQYSKRPTVIVGKAAAQER